MTPPGPRCAAAGFPTTSPSGATRSPVAPPGDHAARPPAFSREDYKQRNVVERAFGRLKQWRDLATRYAKRAAIYRASLVLISALIWLT